MVLEDKLRWDKQHESTLGAGAPSAFLRECLESESWPELRGKALDLACGQGRNSIYLAQRGFAVTAIDISSVALAEGRRRAQEQSVVIDWQQADLETVELPLNEYDLVINVNYLQRSLIDSSKRALRAAGRIIFETYLIDQASIGHPKNPDYLLRHNELLDYFRDFRVLGYREGKFSDHETASYRASIFAEKIAIQGLRDNSLAT